MLFTFIKNIGFIVFSYVEMSSVMCLTERPDLISNKYVKNNYAHNSSLISSLKMVNILPDP